MPKISPSSNGRDPEVLVSQEDVPISVLVELLQFLVPLVVSIEGRQRQGEEHQVAALHSDLLGDQRGVALGRAPELVQALNPGVEERHHVGEPLQRREVTAEAVVHQVLRLEGRLPRRLAGLQRSLVGAQAVGILHPLANFPVVLPALAEDVRQLLRRGH